MGKKVWLAGHLPRKLREGASASLMFCTCCISPAQGQVHGQQAQEMLHARGQVLSYGCSKPWAWALSDVLVSGTKTPRMPQVLVADLWPWWCCSAWWQRYPGSAASVRSRCQCHRCWSSGCVAEDTWWAPVLWAVGSVWSCTHTRVCAPKEHWRQMSTGTGPPPWLPKTQLHCHRHRTQLVLWMP